MPALQFLLGVTGPASGSGQPVRSRCTDPNLPARVLIAAPLEYGAWERGAEVQVLVLLDASGVVTYATVVKSSRDARLDAAALRAARTSTYTPRLQNCVRVPGRYVWILRA